MTGIEVLKFIVAPVFSGLLLLLGIWIKNTNKKLDSIPDMERRINGNIESIRQEMYREIRDIRNEVFSLNEDINGIMVLVKERGKVLDEIKKSLEDLKREVWGGGGKRGGD